MVDIKIAPIELNPKEQEAFRGAVILKLSELIKKAAEEAKDKNEAPVPINVFEFHDTLVGFLFGLGRFPHPDFKAMDQLNEGERALYLKEYSSTVSNGLRGFLQIKIPEIIDYLLDDADRVIKAGYGSSSFGAYVFYTGKHRKTVN